MADLQVVFHGLQKSILESWSAILVGFEGACRVHGNGQLGMQAHNHAL